MTTFLAVVAVVMAVVTAAGVVLLAYGERRDALYRRRLRAAPMHQHDGRPCHGEACAPIREEAA